MKKQINIYYPLAFSMVIIGILMINKVFVLEYYQMNAINVGAALLTLSSVLVGSYVYKRASRIIEFLSMLVLIIGTCIIFFGFLMTGFNEEFFLVAFFSDFETNPLVLICLGITVSSIVTFEKYSNNAIELKSQELNIKVSDLEKKNANLVSKLKEANDHIETLRRKRK